MDLIYEDETFAIREAIVDMRALEKNAAEVVGLHK